jgi:signal transduction histidine kinase
VSGEEVHELAEALRRLATLVARGAPPEEVFAAVAEEVHRQFLSDVTIVCRYEPGGAFSILGSAGNLWPVGSRWPFGGNNLATLVFETGRPARIENVAEATGGHVGRAREVGIRSAVGTPIIVEDRLWGLMAVGTSRMEPMPSDTEARLASFTELVATAIANAESRAGLARLAEEQAALRRVAMLVARGSAPEEVFAAVTDEVERLLGLETAAMIRYESDGTRTVVAISGRLTHLFPVGERVELGGKNVSTLVFETGRPARLNSYADASGYLGDTLRQNGMRQAVGAPIIVEGRLWGAMNAGSAAEHPLPADTETRLVSFTELVATAVANAESRAALAASRARIVAAADESRRRIQRDLHDGAQQRLVHAVIGLKLASRALNNGDANATELVAEALRHAEQANAELRELVHGILPVALTTDGLGGGLDALVSRIPLPVTAHVSVGRLPATVEATAYFIVSEALTNVLKHAHADRAIVTVHADDRRLRMEIRDDGIGGADPQEGSGLIGLSDRVEALGGTLQLTSPTGGGTTLLIQLPVEEPTGTRPGQRPPIR